VAHALSEQLNAKRGRFFEGESVTLEMEGPGVHGEVVAAVAAVLAEHGVTLVGVTTAATARPRTKERAAEQAFAGSPASHALLVARTLRSGQEVMHAGSVVIIGDVNAGARVQAGGNVVVWGRVRGVVEAGLSERGAVVCALDLSPTQLRIGSTVARAPDGAPGRSGPEVARLTGGTIVVEAWT
jgi:septum site-determining protein MinC